MVIASQEMDPGEMDEQQMKVRPLWKRYNKVTIVTFFNKITIIFSKSISKASSDVTGTFCACSKFSTLSKMQIQTGTSNPGGFLFLWTSCCRCALLGTKHTSMMHFLKMFLNNDFTKLELSSKEMLIIWAKLK